MALRSFVLASSTALAGLACAAPSSDGRVGLSQHTLEEEPKVPADFVAAPELDTLKITFNKSVVEPIGDWHEGFVIEGKDDVTQEEQKTLPVWDHPPPETDPLPEKDGGA